MIFLDTNIILRLVDSASAEHRRVRVAVEALEERGEQLVVGLQVLCETWVVATRPRDVNGFGWSLDVARDVVDAVRERFIVLTDDQATTQHWVDVVSAGRVTGKRAHDARIVALMLSHDVEQLLTLNVADFAGLPVRTVAVE